MSNPSRQKGTHYETGTLRGVQSDFPDARRQVLHGNMDQGDIIIPSMSLILECKNCKRMELADWVRQAETEARNAGVDYGAVVHKHKGTTDTDAQYVTMSMGMFKKFLKSKEAGNESDK